VYTFEDALVVGCCLITLLRQAERVRIACLAQLVNTIAPIMTRNGGPAWRQTIFYPFLHTSRYGRGEVLETGIRSPRYANQTFGDVPYLDGVATWNREAGELTVFAVNRSPAEELALEGRLAGFGSCRPLEHLALADADPKAANTLENPTRVMPRRIDGLRLERDCLQALLPPLSWNVLRVRAQP